MQYIDEKNMSSFEKIDVSSWESMSEGVFIRLINQKYLKQYGDDIVSKKFLDLSMCLSVQERKGDIFRSYLLTEQDCRKYDIDIDTAFDVAKKNTENERGKRILSIGQHMLKEHLSYPLVSNTNPYITIGTQQSHSPIGVVGNPESDKDDILILCNKKDTYGSAYISSFSILDEVFRRFDNSNFYIIPTSVFAVLCIKSSYASGNNKKPLRETEEDLLDMLEQLNDSKKDWKNILSYKIYYYYGDDNKQLYVIK